MPKLKEQVETKVQRQRSDTKPDYFNGGLDTESESEIVSRFFIESKQSGGIFDSTALNR